MNEAALFERVKEFGLETGHDLSLSSAGVVFHWNLDGPLALFL